MIFMLVLIIASFFFYIYPKHVGQGIKNVFIWPLL